MFRLKNVFVVGAALLLSPLCAPVARAQWNAYDAMMSTNSYSRGWVNPYDNTLTNIYRSNINTIFQNSMNRSMYFTSSGEGFKKLAGINLRGILGVDPSRVAFDKSGLVIKSA